jgi:hypothetical protein
LTEVVEPKFHVSLRVRRAAAGGVNETAVDMANIIKMAKKIKTIVLEGKTASGGEEGLGRYMFFICYFFSYMSWSRGELGSVVWICAG